MFQVDFDRLETVSCNDKQPGLFSITLNLSVSCQSVSINVDTTACCPGEGYLTGMGWIPELPFVTFCCAASWTEIHSPHHVPLSQKMVFYLRELIFFVYAERARVNRLRRETALLELIRQSCFTLAYFLQFRSLKHPVVSMELSETWILSKYIRYTRVSPQTCPPATLPASCGCMKSVRNTTYGGASGKGAPCGAKLAK